MLIFSYTMRKNELLAHGILPAGPCRGRRAGFCAFRRKDSMEKTIEELIYEETDQRLKEMARPDYPWPRKADGKDWIAIAACIGISLLLIILCMTGVID